MSDILSQLITPELKFAFTLVIVFIALLYILSIIWTVRDAYLRGTNPLIWGLIALIPFLGCMVYAMMRPPLYASDREEQNIGLLLQQRELMAYGECPRCGYPTEREYVLCPNCHTRLKNQCPNCMHTLEPEWTVCPYCATKVARKPRQEAAAATGLDKLESPGLPTGQAPSRNRPSHQGRSFKGELDAALAEPDSATHTRAAATRVAPRRPASKHGSAGAHDLAETPSGSLEA